MRVLPVVIGLGVLLALATPAAAQPSPRLSRVVISGNQRVEEEAIRVQLRSKAGTLLDPEAVDGDIRALYRMGFFENVEADVTEQDGQAVLTYRVTERPLIHELKIEGNKKLSKEDLDAALKVKPNTIFEPDKVRRGIDEAKKEYEKKGYLDARLTYDTKPIGPNVVVLTYTIDEGTIVRITAKITAWYADKDPTKSGYQVLPSNGRLELDLLDRLEEKFGGKPAPPAARSISNPTITAPKPKLDLAGVPGAAIPSPANPPANSGAAKNDELGTLRQ